jgi:Concanavalin A-like lectin/glucanases superfamily
MFGSFARSNALLILTALLGEGVAAGALAQQCTAPPSGQIYWLAADGEYDDHAGFYNGSMSGPVDFVPGMVGSAVRFDSDTDVVFPSVDIVEMRAVRNNFTYELWARPTAATSVCPESQNGNCSGVEHRVAIFPQHGETNAPPGEASLAAGIGLVIGTNAVCVMAHSSFHLPCLLRFDTSINDWIHIAVVVQDKQPRLYLNGVLVRTGLTSPKEFVFASWNVIGSGLSLGKYRGDLDEVSLYGRVLSDAEILAIFNAGSAGKCKSTCTVERANDAWQGAQVTNHSGLRSTDASGMFGGENASPEPTSTLFADGQPDGTVHSIEWQTAQPISLGGFDVFAFHDSVSNFQRGFRHLNLQARQIGGSFVTIYDAPVVVPYASASRELRRCVNLRPLLAQQFRAEFTQQGPPGFSGPRVVELDAIAPDRIFAHGFE